MPLYWSRREERIQVETEYYLFYSRKEGSTIKEIITVEHRYKKIARGDFFRNTGVSIQLYQSSDTRA